MKISTSYNLIFANFMHILNDSMFKMISIFYLITVCGPSYKAAILASNGIAFAIPYLLFSIYASKLSRTMNPKYMMAISKIMEIACMGLVTITSFLRGSYDITWTPIVDILYLSLITMVLGARTCIFVPARYTIVHHMFEGSNIKAITGLISASSYLGILVGIILSSIVSDLINKIYFKAFLFCLIISILGSIALKIAYYPSMGKQHSIVSSAFDLLSVYVQKKTNMAIAILTNSIFMGVSIFSQLNTINFSMDVLHYNETYSGYIYFIIGLGILTGIGIAFMLCLRFPIRYFLISGIGSILSGVSFIALKYTQNHIAILGIMVISGICLGIFILPVEIAIQRMCPKFYISLNMGLCSWLGFVSISITSSMLYIGSRLLSLKSSDMFFLSGIFLIIYGIFLTAFKEVHIKKMSSIQKD